MKKCILIGLFANTVYANETDQLYQVLDIVFGNSEAINTLPIDELNENVDILIDDISNGSRYTSKTTGSQLIQISDLFIDCERDSNGNVVVAKLIRVINDSNPSVRTIAILDKSYCK